MKYKPGDKFIVEVESDDGRFYELRGGFHTCDAVLDSYQPYDESAAYQRGLDDAWDASRRILLLKASDVGTVFNMPYWFDVFKNYSAQEAIAKLCAYEEAQEIHVGDEVKFIKTPWVVTSVDTETGKAFGITQRGKFTSGDLKDIKKTGRHFPEIAAILEKMKDNADV